MTKPSKSILAKGFTHTYSYRLAAYDISLPFSASAQHPIKISHDLMKQVYLRNEDMSIRRNKQEKWSFQKYS